MSARLLLAPPARIISLDDFRKAVEVERAERVRVGVMPAAARTGQVRQDARGCAFGDTPTKYMAFSQVVAAGAQAVILTRAQEKFRAGIVMVASSIGLGFTIDQMTVGTVSQNVAPGTGFLAQLASELSGGMAICFNKVCEPGIDASMTVTNITAVDTLFSAVWLGAAEQVC
jgi:hypothetical protein